MLVPSYDVKNVAQLHVGLGRFFLTISGTTQLFNAKEHSLSIQIINGDRFVTWDTFRHT